ncbi:sensor histidine kinase [Pseudoduganella violaceinigra]|uniref:sensor histidine kinase n=1 Tax=Pseudoduganella violaceinigra TaxID=246602 RepID=UPI001E3CB14D|nr:histidine kinase [Pseudoduganella violaceinigra]
MLIILGNGRYTDSGTLASVAWVCASGWLLTSAWHRFFKARRWNRHGNDWRLPAMALLVIGPLQAVSWEISARLFLKQRGVMVDQFASELALGCTLMLVWTICYMLAAALRRASRLEAEALRLEILAKDAELRALQSQVNPHFFFNSLNSVRALMYEDVDNAANMVDQLASLMRYTLMSTFNGCVPLQQEMDAVRAYLAIEQIRFEERLRMHIEIEPGMAQVTIPPMTVQNLVENAVKYGVERRTDGSEIRIVVRQSASDALIEVANQGALLVNSGSTRIGIGNARKRLALAKGEQSSLDLSEQDGWVRATLRFPLAA